MNPGFQANSIVTLFILYLYICLGIDKYDVTYVAIMVARRGWQMLWNWSLVDCDLSHVHAGNHSWVLWKSSKCA